MTTVTYCIANASTRSLTSSSPALTRFYNALPRFQRAYIACKALQSNAAYNKTRNYATTTPTTASTTTTKRASTIRSPAKTTKAAVKAKAKPKAAPKPKAKKKVVKKKKVIKKKKVVKKKKVLKKKPVVKKPKVLSEATKTRNARKTLVHELRDLRLKCLEPPATKPELARNLFFASQKGKVTGSDALPELQRRYRDLPTTEKESLEREAAHNKQENHMMYHNWILQHTPQEIKDANRARTSLRLKLRKLATKRPPKAGTLYSLKDERQVKRALPPNVIYYQERCSAHAFEGVPHKEAFIRIATEYKELSPTELKKYTDLAEADKARYIREHTDTYGKAPPVLKARAPRKPKSS